MPEADPATLSVLRVARRRVATGEFMDRLVRTGVGMGGILVALAAWRLASGQPRLLVEPWEVTATVVLPTLLSAGWTWWRWPTRARAAGWLDRRANTRDRFTTALALAKRGPETLSEVERLATAECARFAGGFDPRPWSGLSPKRGWMLVMAPPVALALLMLGALLRHGGGPKAVDPALQATLRAQADELQRAADAVAGKKDDADRRLAEELARAAERLRQAAALRNPDPEAARRDALKGLSDLQDRLRRLASNGPFPAELAALAAALQREGSEAAKAAAEALKKGDASEAARQLEKLLEELKKNADPAAALDRLARAMQDQAGKLSENERGELARQMAAAQAEAKQREDLLKKIADLLRQRGGAAGQPSANRGGQGQPGQGGEQPGEGDPGSTRGLSNQQLQSLLNSLENMKNGLNGNGAPGQGGMSLALGNEPPSGGVQTSPPPGGSGDGPPGGAPGSERDPGTSELGNRPVAAAPAPNERAARASGLLGEGETLSDLAPSTDPAAPARSGRRYREVYEAMAPAARDSVRQENIPLGSRVLVERYFQNIRPPD